VSFSNTNLTNATVTFSSNGVYSLLLKADDGVHTPAYDAVIITVADGIRVSAERSGGNIALRWMGGAPPYTLESTTTLAMTNWITVGTFATNSATIPRTNGTRFLRVRAP
jgi:hypothetical protein